MKADPAAFREAGRRALEQTQGVLNSAAMDQIEDIISGKQAYDTLLWRMICFGQWMERFSVEV